MPLDKWLNHNIVYHLPANNNCNNRKNPVKKQSLKKEIFSTLWYTVKANYNWSNRRNG